MELQVKLLHPKAQVPTYGTKDAAGADLYACLEDPVTIKPGQTQFLPTGLAVAIPAGHVGLVLARSGLACKRGLAPANKVGVIDSDYRGEVLVALHNHSAQQQRVEPGDRVAQLVIVPILSPSLRVVDDLSETERGEGGFGSTGRN